MEGYCELGDGTEGSKIGNFSLNFLLGGVGIVEVFEAEESVAEGALEKHEHTHGEINNDKYLFYC